jgi:hypothetical protein
MFSVKKKLKAGNKREGVFQVNDEYDEKRGYLIRIRRVQNNNSMGLLS